MEVAQMHDFYFYFIFEIAQVHDYM